MNNYEILGIIIIIGLVFSICAVTIDAINNNNEQLTENSLNNISGVKTVNLNITQEVGGVKINFTDKNNIYNITSNSNTPIKVNYTQDGDVLNVTIDSNESDTNIELSDKYIYNINSNIVFGGLDVNFTNGNVKNFNSNIILGGGNFILDNGNVEKIKSIINTGGANIIGNPNNKVEINSDIVIGGMNIKPNEQNLDLKSYTRLGGVHGSSYTSKVNDNYTEYIGKNTSKNVISLESQIQIGGLNLI